MLSALNDDLPDDLLSGWESGNSTSNGSMPNGNPDPMSNNVGMMMGMRNPGMGQMGGMLPNQNMNLVNALNKGKQNGPGLGGAPTSVPHSSMNDNMTSINSSLQSPISHVSIGHSQMSMSPMNSMSGDMNTMVSSGMSNIPSQGMQMRTMMSQPTIMSSQVGMPNGPMVRHVNQMGGPMNNSMQMQGQQMLGGQPRMLGGPGVRMQTMVSCPNPDIYFESRILPTMCNVHFSSLVFLEQLTYLSEWFSLF